MNKLLLNSAILYKNFVLENIFLMVSAIKEFIFKNQKRWSCGKSFLWKNDSWFIRIAWFFKIWSIIILLFLKAKLSIFAWGLIFVDENYHKRVFLETIFFETVITITRKVFGEWSWFTEWIFIEHASSVRDASFILISFFALL